MLEMIILSVCISIVTSNFILAAGAGKLGAGKTLTLSREAYYFWKKGYKIYTNYELLKIPHTQIYHREEIIEIGLSDMESKKFFALDEGYLFFDAMEKSASTQKYYRNLINITRKMGMVLYFTTQSLGQMNLRTRLLFDFIFLPRYYPKKKMLKINYFLSTINGQYVWIKEKRYRKVNQFFQFYKTKEIINEFIRQANENDYRKGSLSPVIQPKLTRQIRKNLKAQTKDQVQLNTFG